MAHLRISPRSANFASPSSLSSPPPTRSVPPGHTRLLMPPATSRNDLPSPPPRSRARRGLALALTPLRQKSFLRAPSIGGPIPPFGRALIRGFPTADTTLVQLEGLVGQGLAAVDEPTLVAHAAEARLMMDVVLNGTSDVNELGASACEAFGAVKPPLGSLFQGAALIALAAVAVRMFLLRDIFYLFDKILDIDQMLERVPNGAKNCGIAAAAVSAVLVGATAWVTSTFSTGMGLPVALEAGVQPLIQILFTLIKMGTIATILLAAATIAGAYKRGCYVSPTHSAGGDYKTCAIEALKNGSWVRFQAIKLGSSLLYNIVAFLALSVAVVLLLVIGALFGISYQASETCHGIFNHVEAASEGIGSSLYPRLPFNFTELAYASEPLVDTAKILADGVLKGNPLTELTVDPDFMDRALHVDMAPFCGAATSLLANGSTATAWTLPVGCADLLPTVSIFISSNPLVAGSLAQAEYYEKFEPICTEFESTIGALDTFCKSDSPSLDVAPTNVKDHVIQSFSGFFGTVDAALTFLFENPNTKTAAQIVLDLDMRAVRKYAESLDHIEYDRFFSKTCAEVNALQCVSCTS